MKGILLNGYGTRDGNLEAIMEKQAARLRARGRENVYIGYFRVSEPSVRGAVTQMLKDGIDDILAVPYYIAEGRLTYEMIPNKIDLPDSKATEGELDGKKYRIRFAPAFGMSEDLTHIICDRIADAGGDKDCGILLLGHGSRERSLPNQAVVSENADRLRKMGYDNVVIGFNEFSERTVEAAVKELVSKDVKKIVCVPLFIATGIHLCEEIPEKIGIPMRSSGGMIQCDGKQVYVKYTRPVEDDPRLLENIDRKIEEFLSE